MDDQVRSRIEEKIKDLPTLPTVATRILEVTNDPEASVDDLREIISTDQVVAGRILRAVNSAYYGFPRQIDTLSKAIVILGFNNVRSLALSVSIMEVFSTKNSTGFNYKELWKHAVGTAFSARSLARIFHPRDVEKHFIAGLLHDIGLVAMDQCFHGEFAAVLSQTKKTGRPLYLLEEEKFSFNHGDVGQFVADQWLLPKGLSQAIGLHHSPAKAEDEDKEIVFSIHAADFLCKQYNFGDFGDNDFFEYKNLYRPALDMYKISKDGPDEEVQKILDVDMEGAAGFLDAFG